MRIRTSRLPTGYREIEYIQGTGTQYIVLPTNLQCDYFELVCQYTSTPTAEMCIIGNSDSGSANRFELFCDANRPTYNLWTAYNSQGTTQSTVSATTKAILSYNYTTSTFLVNWSNPITKTLNQQPYTLLQYGNGNYIAKAKVFGYWASKNGSIVIKLIPCVRVSDGKPGLYNVIGNTFLTNGASSGSDFTAGPYKDSYRVLSGSVTCCPKTTRLSNEYQETTYTASANGSQYFEIPFVPNGTTGFKVEFGFNPTVTGKRYCLLSNYNTGDGKLSLELNAANKVRLWLNNGALDKTSSNTFNIGSFNTTVYEFKNNAWSITLNGTVTSGTYTWTAASTSTKMRAFLDLAGRTSTFSSPLQFSYIRIYEGDTLTYNLIPCYRKSDNVIGMYDIINKVFYYNIGSGNFTKGSNNTKII